MTKQIVDAEAEIDKFLENSKFKDLIKMKIENAEQLATTINTYTENILQITMNQEVPKDLMNRLSFAETFISSICDIIKIECTISEDFSDKLNTLIEEKLRTKLRDSLSP